MTFASLGPNLPHNLLNASADHAGPLGWNIDRATPQADVWLESKFPLWSRSVLEDWASGALDHLDAVVFSRADDACQRLYYYACELRRTGAIKGPEPLIVDIAKAPRASSLARDETALRQLAGQIGVDEAALEASIAAGNARRAATPDAPGGDKVCLLAGSPPPDLRLHDAVRAAGWSASGPTLAQAWADPGPLVDEGTGNPFAALARQVHASQTGPRGFYDRTAAVVNAAQQAAASAALLWLIEEDDTAVWHLPAMRAALEQAGLPVLVATRRDWRCNDGIADELAAFLQGVRS